MRSCSTMSDKSSLTLVESFIHWMSTSGADLSAVQQWMVPRPNRRCQKERLRVMSMIRYSRISSSSLLKIPVSIYSFSLVREYLVKVQGRPKTMRLRSVQTMSFAIMPDSFR